MGRSHGVGAMGAGGRGVRGLRRGRVEWRGQGVGVNGALRCAGSVRGESVPGGGSVPCPSSRKCIPRDTVPDGCVWQARVEDRAVKGALDGWYHLPIPAQRRPRCRPVPELRRSFDSFRLFPWGPGPPSCWLGHRTASGSPWATGVRLPPRPRAPGALGPGPGLRQGGAGQAPNSGAGGPTSRLGPGPLGPGAACCRLGRRPAATVKHHGRGGPLWRLQGAARGSHPPAHPRNRVFLPQNRPRRLRVATSA